MTPLALHALLLALLLGGFARLAQHRPGLAVRGAWPVAGVVGLALFAVSDPRGLFEDFREAYLAAGIAVMESPQALQPLLERGVNGFVNLPIVAYLFAPFAALPTPAALLLFALIGLLLTLAGWWLLVRSLGLDSRAGAALLLVFAASGPLAYSLREGNTSHMLLPALALAMALLVQRRDVLAGALLGALALIKLPLLLFGVYYALRGRWRVSLGGLAVVLAAAAASVGVFGWPMHVLWYELCVKAFGEHPMPAFNVQSVPAFFLRWQTGAAGLFDWTAQPLAPLWKACATATLVLLYLGVALRILRAPGGPAAAPATGPAPPRDALEFMLVLGLACMTSPLSWTHYYAWFLLPAALFLRERLSAAPRGRDALGWFALWSTAVPVMGLLREGGPLAEFYARSLVSLPLLGGLAWLVWLSLRLGRSGAPPLSPVPRP